MITCYNQDALELLKTLPDKSIGFCYTDPPYQAVKGVDYERTIDIEYLVNVIKELCRVCVYDVWVDLCNYSFEAELVSKLKPKNIFIYSNNYMRYPKLPCSDKNSPHTFHSVLQFNKNTYPREFKKRNLHYYLRNNYLIVDRKSKNIQSELLKEYLKEKHNIDIDKLPINNGYGSELSNNFNIQKQKYLRNINKDYITESRNEVGTSTGVSIKFLVSFFALNNLHNLTFIDPFAGTGSTGKALKILNPETTGIINDIKVENKEDYWKVLCTR